MGLPTLGATACIGRPVKIYVLIDGRSGRGFYVGATSRRLCDRLSNHKTNAVRLNVADQKSQVIRDIVSAGQRVEILELETVPAEGWAEAEQFWISYLRVIGAVLTNKSIGGAGNQGMRISEDTRRRMAASAAGRDMSSLRTPAVREKAAAANRIPVIVGGAEYPGIKAAVRATGTPYSTLMFWLRTGRAQYV